MNKLWCVKAFHYDEGGFVKDRWGQETKIKKYLRVLGIVSKDLTWQKAKEERNKYSVFGASIFPNPPAEELKVIRLG